MSNDVLLRFLSNGLIDVGGDDAKLEKLRTTSADLAASLKKTPAKTVPFALLAFDPNAPAEDPGIREALDALRRHWATYVNTFSATPVAVIRAILLDALAKAAAEDDRVAVAFVSSARNALPFMEAGHELAIWSSVVTAIETKVDARAEAEWATPSSISLPPLEVELPRFAAPTITAKIANKDTLMKAMRAAAGPQFYDAKTQQNIPTSGNPHWPQANQAHWPAEFGERSAKAIAEMIDAVVGSVGIEQSDQSEPMRAFSAGVTEHVATALRAVSGATAGLQRRTNLIWWKETLFSPSAHLSYRDLPPGAAAAQMAFDLHKQVPTYSPASVSAFLFEAVLGLPGVDSKTTFDITELVSEAQANEYLAALRDEAAKMVDRPDGRGPVIALIGHSDAPAAHETTEFRRLTGIPQDAQITLPGWAAWIFRELQAARATIDNVKTPRRMRKN